MAKQHLAAYLPLKILKETTEKFPRVWEIMQDFHENNGRNELPS